VAYLDTLWRAEPTAVVDATLNPLVKVHSGARHLTIRFSRLVVDGRVHHIIVSIERISAPRVVPQTIEVPVLDADTFAKRLAGETGTRPALEYATPDELMEPGSAELPAAPRVGSALAADAARVTELPAMSAIAPPPVPPPMVTGEFELGPLEVTEDSLPSVRDVRVDSPTMTLPSLADPLEHPVGSPEIAQHLATTITSPDAAPLPIKAPRIEPPAIIDPPDPRLNEVLREIMHVDAGRLENFLAEARDKAGQLRAIIKLPAREPQAFREKLVLILEMIRGLHARAQRLPLPSVCERAERFEAALGRLRDKQTLSGNDFLPLAVKLDDLLSHLAIQGEVVARLHDWHAQNSGGEQPPIDATQRSATATGTTIRQPNLRGVATDEGNLNSPSPSATQKTARLSDLSQESLEEMSTFLADMYSKRVSLVVVGLEDVPSGYRRPVEKILGQLIHNAIRHGLETPADRVAQDKPEIGTVAVQFTRAGADGYQLSVQDDGRGLDHDKIRAEAVRQGVLTPDAAATIDVRQLASLIFRPGFTTVGAGAARGIGMDLVRDLVSKAGGRVGIATKPGEYTRFRITLPHEKKASDAAVA
jgi:signal transduction histidine kinase